MKKVILFTLFTSLLLQGFAQQEVKDYYELVDKKAMQNSNVDTVAWVYNGTLTLGANQGILHNWLAGGELASLTVNGLFAGTLTRYYNKHLWTNNLDAAYGLFYANSNNFVPRKTDDRIDLTSKYGYKLHNKKDLYFATLLNARTQFTKAYNYDVPNWDTFTTSRFFSPMYVTFAPGLEYRKGSQVSLFFSPLAARFTFVDKYYTNANPEGAYGVEHGKNMRFELGAYLTARYQKELAENISYRTRLDLYTNYLAKDRYDNAGVLVKKDNPGNIDIMWDNFIAFKFYKYFSINIGVTAIYDNDVPYYSTYTDGNGVVQSKNEPFSGLGWWQIKQVMNIGFNYTF